MEKVDTALQSFLDIKKFADENIGTIITEADTRLKLINDILVDVLGWKKESISAEDHTESGYIDYLLSSGGRNLFLVEAKRLSFDILSTKIPEYRFYKVGGPALQAGQDGIEQATSYCRDKSIEYSSLTNGISWVGFRALRIDGIQYKDGQAAVFPNLEAIQKNFAAFYELFSLEGVSRKMYKIYLDRAEGSPLSTTDPLVRTIPSSRIHLLRKNDLSVDLEAVFDEFFQTITDNDDEEFLSSCFVETPESHEADRSLKKITREIVNSIRTDAGAQLEKEIASSFESKKGQTVLLVGNKGSGKSTFIDRFFRLVLDRSIKDKCLILKIDLSRASGSIEGLQEWLTDELIERAEAELYDGKNPEYDELVGIFFDHYQRWSTGEHKHLYDSDPTLFKIKFGEFLDTRRREKPNRYLHSVLKRAIRQRTLVPCIIFDNADNFPSEFQDAVFQYAYSLFKEVNPSVVIVPITDRTIWRLHKTGALQSYHSKSFYLPVPSPKEVINKRVLFIKRKLSEGKERSREYFTSKGLRIKVENIKFFAACVEQAFIKTDYVARRIGGLSNYELRRSLQLSKEIITAPILKVEELMAANFSKDSVKIPFFIITKAILYGNYNKFQDSNEYVVNLFEPETDCLNSPLLRLSLLRLLLDRHNASKGGIDSYISFEEIESFFEPMGVDTNALLSSVYELTKARLADPYDPTVASGNEPTIHSITPTTKLAIAPSGRTHLDMALNDNIYVSEMAQITSLRSEKTVSQLRSLLEQRYSTPWDKIIKTFILYCLDEDKKLLHLPSHSAYTSQATLRKDLHSKWSESLRKSYQRLVRA